MCVSSCLCPTLVCRRSSPLGHGPIASLEEVEIFAFSFLSFEWRWLCLCFDLLDPIILHCPRIRIHREHGMTKPSKDEKDELTQSTCRGSS